MEKAKKRSAAEPAAAPDPTESATVYVVEDDAVMREYLAELVRSVGFPVESFDSAENFLKHFVPGGPGCILLDVRMPGMSGLELQEKLRADQVTIPIIIITAHADVPMAVRAMHTGAFDFIEKPVNAQGLLERVRHAVDFDADHHKSHEYLNELRGRTENLSPRETEVMELVVRGFLNKQIAAELGLSIKTVEVHRGRVMEKMKADNLADLIRMATALGIGTGDLPEETS